MTALAFKDGILACDTQVEDGYSGILSTTQPKMVKVVIGGTQVVIAFSGALGTIRSAIIDTIQSQHTYAASDNDRCTLMAITADRRLFIKDGRSSVLIPTTERIAAYGSAMEFLNGAMHVGASATEAVEAAIRARSDIGGRVMWADWDGNNWDDIPSFTDMFGDYDQHGRFLFKQSNDTIH